jgi:HNH endonuclease
MTTRQALVRMHAIQSWHRVPLAKDGRPYGPGIFAGRAWETRLLDENRRISVRLARIATCLRCTRDLDSGSTGDHIIPRSRGGPDGATNYLPLCRSCNASKGAKDLIEWWLASARSAVELPDDVLCAYARLMYRWSLDRGALDEPAPPSLRTAVEQLIAPMAAGHAAAVMRLP